MWRLQTAQKTGESPFLQSLNHCQGRQVWEFSQTAGTPAERQEVEQLRAAFTANRSADTNLMSQCQPAVECADSLVESKLSPQELVARILWTSSSVKRYLVSSGEVVRGAFCLFAFFVL